jgi:type I restriction enzyme S subunit
MRVKLGDVCDRGSSNLIQKEIVNKSGQYPIYGASGQIGSVDFFHQDSPYVAVVKDGAGIGRTMLLPAKSSIIGTLQYLLPRPNVLPDYLCYVVQYMHLEKYFSGATIPHIYFRDYKNEEFNLVSIEEQKAIVEILNKLQGIIEKRHQQLRKLDDLAKARFVEMFGDMYLNDRYWSEIRLDCMASIVSGITKGRKIKSTDISEVPYMSVSNVKDGYIDWTTVKTIMATKAEIERYRLYPYDVLMTEGGDPDKLGRGAVIRQPLKDCIHQNHIFRVRLDTNVMLPVYFAEYLQHQKAKKYFLGCAKQTTGIASINMKQLSALPVLCPPMDLQKQFSAFVIQIDKSKEAVQQALDKTQQLFDSLMQQYFA